MKNALLSSALLIFLSPTLHSEGARVPTTPGAPKAEPIIDCKYRIPSAIKLIDEALISKWAQQAAIQSFDFNPATLDAQLITLKSCYTDQGYKSFSEALAQSGNISAIKTQHLAVSSQVDGKLTINAIKDNQWKISLPMHVVYQNDKERLTQDLSVELLVGRKISGDLGIIQMIASPRHTAEAKTTAPGCSTCGH